MRPRKIGPLNPADKNTHANRTIKVRRGSARMGRKRERRGVPGKLGMAGVAMQLPEVLYLPMQSSLCAYGLRAANHTVARELQTIR